jgi:hypothetical protein
MAFSRYRRENKIAGGEQLRAALCLSTLRSALKNGRLIPVNQVILTGNDRLDTLAGKFYGDGSYWWVLAAASEIGWGLQVPPGTVINVLNLSDVEALVG